MKCSGFWHVFGFFGGLGFLGCSFCFVEVLVFGFFFFK